MAVLFLVGSATIGWVSFNAWTENRKIERSTVPIKKSPATVTHVDIDDGKVGLKYIANKKVRGAIVFTGEESAKYSVGDNVCFNGSYIAAEDEMVVNKIVECK
jgi:hypothetical protein